METTTTTNEVALIPVDGIRMWDNARKSCDQRGLEELARSIADSGGALQPPVGYRVEGEAHEVELVMGERRWRAYAMLRNEGREEYAQIPVRLIERPAPRDAYKWSLVENVQREDLKPSELGAWLATMLGLVDEETGAALWSQRSLAEEIGKPLSFVSLALALTRAPEEAVRAVDSGRCCLETGALVGGLPPEMREGAMEEMITGPMGAMDGRAARAWVQERYRRDLRRADFDLETSGLAGEPACVRCQWYGGNRDDVAGKASSYACLNPACFLRKQRAAANLGDAGAVEEGFEEGGSGAMAAVVEGAIFEPHSGRVSPESGYVDLSDRPSPMMLADGGRGGAVVPSWGELLRDAGASTVSAWDEHGVRHELAEVGEAIRGAVSSRWGGLFREGVAKDYLSPAERAVERAVRAAGDREWRAAAAEGLCELRTGLATGSGPGDALAACARIALEAMAKGDDLALLAEVLGLSDSQARLAEAISARLGAMGGADLTAALAMVLLARRVRYEGFAWLVQEDGEPGAALCLAGDFDAGAWHRRMKRRRASAELDARGRAEADLEARATEDAAKRAAARA